MVDKAVVLSRIQHLQQSAGRVALIGDAQLVDLVQQKDRVLAARLLHALQDPARHGAHVGTPVAADIGLVPSAAEGDPNVLAAHRSGDRLRDRGLADSRGTDKEEDRRTGGPIVFVPRRFLGASVAPGRVAFLVVIRPELPYRQELEHTVLDFLQTVMILVQDACSLGEIQVLLQTAVPGQLGNGLEIGPHDLVLHRLPIHARQASQLAVHFFSRLLRQLERIELLPQVVDLFGLVRLPQLLPDGFELFAQNHFPLPIPELPLDA